MRWPFNIPFINPKFLEPMTEGVQLAKQIAKKNRWFEFHGELYLFGVKVWDFRIPPQSEESPNP